MTQDNLDGNSVIDVEQEDHVAVVGLMVRNVFDSASVEVDDSTLKVMTNGVCFAIKRTFRGLTFDDLQTALQSGVCNVYGDVYKINVPNMCAWINSYWKETMQQRMERRAAENKANNTKAITANAYMTEAERMQHNRDLTNSLYKSFCNGDTDRLAKLYEIAFDYLSKTGRLQCTTEQWQTACQQAAAEVKANNGHVENNIFRQAVTQTTTEQSIIVLAKKKIVINIFKSIKK